MALSSAVSNAQSLGEALDATNLIWTTSGVGPWVAETNVTHDGISAAQGPGVAPGFPSTLQTTVEGPAKLSFWWKAYLSQVVCTVGHVEQATILALPGQPADWRQQTIYVGSGSQEVQWLESYTGTRSTRLPLAGWIR